MMSEDRNYCQPIVNLPQNGIVNIGVVQSRRQKWVGADIFVPDHYAVPHLSINPLLIVKMGKIGLTFDMAFVEVYNHESEIFQ